LNARSYDGYTAFDYAAGSGSIETAQAIMNDSAFEGLNSRSASYPLHRAAADNRTQMIEFLLDKQVLDINKKDTNGRTALMIAASTNSASAVSLLIRRGADTSGAVRSAVSNDASGALGALIDSGKYTVESPEIVNALHFAVNENKPNIFKYLLEKGVNINVKDSAGNTALVLAVTKVNKGFVKILLAKKADVNVQNNRGETALMIAAANSETDILEWLLKAEADFTIKDTNGKTALQHAIDNKHKDTRKALEKSGAKF
jgi:ankyrin repeat protein